jgi:hypothetical protein
MDTDIQDQTPTVTCEDGYVVMDGLPGVALTFTAEVAEELGGLLAAAAVVAFGHRSVRDSG